MQFDKKEIREKMRLDNYEHRQQEAEKRKQVAAEKGLLEEITDKDNVPYRLAFVSGNTAIYLNDSDDILIMDMEIEETTDELTGFEKFMDVMDKVINQGLEYEFGERFAYFCSGQDFFGLQGCEGEHE